MELEGELDLQGFLALNDAILPGYQKIHGRVKSSPLEKLRQAVNAHCLVLDIISNPVRLEPELVQEAAEDAERVQSAG